MIPLARPVPRSTRAADRIRVLIVDDSLVIRHLIREALGGDPAIEIVGAEANGEYQNYTESDATLQGDGATPASVTIPLVAGVEVVAGEKLEVSCIEFQAKKGDSAGADILATTMSSIAGAMNP